jgi:hypothetical protein
LIENRGFFPFLFFFKPPEARITMGRNIAYLNASVMGIFLMAFILTGTARADMWSNQTCINGVETSLVCNGVCTASTMLFNHTQTCRFGCNNQTYTCNQPTNLPEGIFSLTVLVFLAMAGMFALFAIKFKDDWGILTIIFYIMSMLFIVMTIGIIGSFLTIGQYELSTLINTAYFAAESVLFVFLLYIILRFVLRFALRFTESVARKH